MDHVIKPAFAAILNKDMAFEIDSQLQKLYFKEASERIVRIVNEGFKRRVCASALRTRKFELVFEKCYATLCEGLITIRYEGNEVVRVTHHGHCDDFDPTLHGIDILFKDTLEIETQGQNMVCEV
nr:hypothetical protein K-LCC10_0259 [Kaumoebavirus]